MELQPDLSAVSWYYYSCYTYLSPASDFGYSSMSYALNTCSSLPDHHAVLVIIHVLRDTVPVLIVPGRHGMAVIVLIPALITCRVRGGYQVPCLSIPLANVSSFTSESGIIPPVTRLVIANSRWQSTHR